MSKAEIIKKVDYDRSGFNSRKTTLKDVRAIDKTITKDDVDSFISKNTEQKRQLRGFNSFIAPYPKYEFNWIYFLSTTWASRPLIRVWC